MSTILFTERKKEIVYRFLDLYYNESIEPKTRKELAKMYAYTQAECIVSSISIGKGLKVILERDITFHEECEDYCNEDNDECECVLQGNTDIKIKYNDATIYFKTIFIRMGEDQKEHLNIPIEQVKEMISAITDFKICQCGEIAIKDNWCRSCYLYRYIRTEEEGGNCSICMENEGRWGKTECNHIFHQHCFNTIQHEGSTWNRKCPLCRSTTRIVDHHPYDK